MKKPRAGMNSTRPKEGRENGKNERWRNVQCYFTTKTEKGFYEWFNYE
jgi:hypothetical protein